VGGGRGNAHIAHKCVLVWKGLCPHFYDWLRRKEKHLDRARLRRWRQEPARRDPQCERARRTITSLCDCDGATEAQEFVSTARELKEKQHPAYDEVFFLSLFCLRDYIVLPKMSGLSSA